METSPAPYVSWGGYKSGGGREQLKERKDGSPAVRNSIGKGGKVGGKTMGRGGSGLKEQEEEEDIHPPGRWLASLGPGLTVPLGQRGSRLTIKPGGPRGPWMPLKPMSPGGPCRRQRKAVCAQWPRAEAPAAPSPLGSGQPLASLSREALLERPQEQSQMSTII